jgi:hypothetical protein
LTTLDTGLRRYDDVDGFFTIATQSPAWGTKVALCVFIAAFLLEGCASFCYESAIPENLK